MSVNVIVAVCVNMVIIRGLAIVVSTVMTTVRKAMAQAMTAAMATLIYICAGARKAVAACLTVAPAPASGYSSI